MKQKIEVKSITYRVEVPKETIRKIIDATLEKGVGLPHLLITNTDGKVLKVEYEFGKPDIHITVKINDVKQIKRDPKLWSIIENTINNHLDNK